MVGRCWWVCLLVGALSTSGFSCDSALSMPVQLSMVPAVDPVESPGTYVLRAEVDMQRISGTTVNMVEFYRDGDAEPIYTDETAPYEYPWQVTADDDGAHRFRAVAHVSFEGVAGSDEWMSNALDCDVDIDAGTPAPGPPSLGEVGWWQQLQGPDSGMREVRQIHVDHANNIILAGYCEDSILLGGVPFTCTDGITPLFVAKLTPEGSLLWARVFEMWPATGVEAVVDSAGNITVAVLYIGQLIELAPNGVELPGGLQIRGREGNGTLGRLEVALIQFGNEGEIRWHHTLQSGSGLAVNSRDELILGDAELAGSSIEGATQDDVSSLVVLDARGRLLQQRTLPSGDYELNQIVVGPDDQLYALAAIKTRFEVDLGDRVVVDRLNNSAVLMLNEDFEPVRSVVFPDVKTAGLSYYFPSFGIKEMGVDEHGQVTFTAIASSREPMDVQLPIGDLVDLAKRTYVVVRTDSNLNPVWMRQLDTQTNGTLEAMDVHTDGHVVLTGKYGYGDHDASRGLEFGGATVCERLPGTADKSAYVMMVDSAGSASWTNCYGTHGATESWAVKFGGDGSVIAAPKLGSSGTVTIGDTQVDEPGTVLIEFAPGS